MKPKMRILVIHEGFEPEHVKIKILNNALKHITNYRVERFCDIMGDEKSPYLYPVFDCDIKAVVFNSDVTGLSLENVKKTMIDIYKDFFEGELFMGNLKCSDFYREGDEMIKNMPAEYSELFTKMMDKMKFLINEDSDISEIIERLAKKEFEKTVESCVTNGLQDADFVDTYNKTLDSLKVEFGITKLDTDIKNTIISEVRDALNQDGVTFDILYDTVKSKIFSKKKVEPLLHPDNNVNKKLPPLSHEDFFNSEEKIKFEMPEKNNNARQFDTGAKRNNANGKGRFDLLPYSAIFEIAQLFEEGAINYGDRNWEKGIPMSCMMDSGIRHATQYMMGNVDEDHLRAAAWNFICALWMRKNRPEMQDIPTRIEAEKK